MDTESKQVTVEVPEDRVAEFHAFFARFLARSPRQGRRGRYGGPHRGHHRHHCARRGAAAEHGAASKQSEAAEHGDPTAQPADIGEA